MGDPMHGIEADVEFDFADATALRTACTSVAQTIGGQQGSRRAWAGTALTDFRGHFAELFATNADTADLDAGEVVAALQATATAVAHLAEDAQAEQDRRNEARAWKAQHDNRGFGGWLDDTFGDGDDCPIPEPQPRMSFAPPSPPTRERQTPEPGSGGGGGTGTSAARPRDLHFFATSSAGANGELAGEPGRLRSLYSAFQASCQWGTLSADGVLTGLDRWTEANDDDVRWANTVGDAFAAAGGEGAVSALPDSALAAALRAADVSATRADLDVTMPSALGSPPTTGYANDPVNTSTGNFTESEVDLEVASACSSLWWRRSYNSVHDHVGAFGPGWSSWCDAGLVLSDESAALTLPDGRRITFPRLGSGWDRATGANLWLTREPSSAHGAELLVVSGNDGSRWVHTGAGRLLSVEVGEGTEVSLTWDQDRLVRLTHERGRAIDLEWLGDGREARIVAVRASDGRTVSFDYDDGRLVAATGPLGTRRYGWDEAGLIASVTDADGVVEAANTYDEHGRVVRQRSPFGRITRFAYLPGRVTVVSDEDGTRANTWIADDRGRLVGVVDAHGRRQSMAYDAHDNKVLVTERDGSVIISEHDTRGRRVRQVTPGGADVVYAYDELDRVTRVEVTGGDPMVDGTGTGTGTAAEDGAHQVAVTTLTYEGEQRSPSAVTDPEGGVTRMVWAGGLLQQVSDATGTTSHFTYDEHGELETTTDAEGNVARLERDAAGRVTAAVTPTGQRTTYAYDPASGMLAERVGPDGATWRYERTAAGRLAAVTDPTGSRTEVEHGPHGEESATIDPLGRAVRRTYDDLGQVTASVLPDGSRWEFAHDTLGRVIAVTDPEGGTLHQEHDVVGAPTAVTDPTGVRRELAEASSGAAASLEVFDGAPGESPARLDLDKLGRLVSETGPDGSVRLTRYDRCGRPVEVVDPVGGVTRAVRDAAGRIVTLIQPTGAEVSYTYDACGRLSTITDQTGATSRRVYDADGRVVEQHLPTGEVATTRFEANGRVAAMRVPGVGTTTYAYDAAGRVVETRDPRSGRRRFTYDAAGQLVAATDANGGVTAYGYDEGGRCTEITHPDRGVTRRAYDAHHRLVSETDPLGRTTTAEYDAAGRQVSQTDPAGSRTEWRYESGRLAAVVVDGVVQSSIDRDVPGRRIRVTDRSGADGSVVEHELEWDARGLLVARTRDGVGPRWRYDANGACVALTAADGAETSYARDAAGRLVGVTHPLLGTALIERDAAGRQVVATAGGRTQRWSYDDGFLAVHEVDGSTRTRIVRDDDGRIARVETESGPDGEGRAPQSTAYSYDAACQLVAAVTSTSTGETPAKRTQRWRYDAAGRLVAERFDGVTRELLYDAAGQLVASRTGEQEVVSYAYDAVGRRTGERYADGSTRDFTWSPTGWLSSVTTTDGAGAVRRTGLVVDALGELSRIEGPDGRSTEVVADTANPWNGLLSVGGRQVTQAGGFTGISDGTTGEAAWTDPGWRDARTMGPDPWSLPTEGVPELPFPGSGTETGFELTETGELLVGGTGGTSGLEWLGRRAYDPATRGFLSVDAREALTGAGWAGNPYSFAGNDPLHALDPMGLSPVTDEQLRAYNAANGGFGDTAAGQWLKNNWEYVAGGAMVLGGAALMFVPGGQVFGMGLMSAGADTIIQRATTGEVNWGQVAVSGVLGMAGGAGAGLASKAGMTGWKAAATAGMVDGAWQGGAASGAGYLMGDGPHTVGGFFGAAGTGTLFGAGSGGALGVVSHGATSAASHLRGGNAVVDDTIGQAGRELGETAPTPAAPTPPARPRLPQDINVNPIAPDPLPLNRPVGTSPSQNAYVQQRIADLQAGGAIDLRVNQQQVDLNGTRVGVNRPDLQYTQNGQRVYEEFDRPPPVRAAEHEARILANDPAGAVNLFTVP